MRASSFSVWVLGAGVCLAAVAAMSSCADPGPPLANGGGGDGPGASSSRVSGSSSRSSSRASSSSSGATGTGGAAQGGGGHGGSGGGGGSGGAGGCDCPHPGVECKETLCLDGGLCGVGNLPDGSACSLGACVGGTCFPCFDNSGCTTAPNTACHPTAHVCTTPGCADHARDGNETDTDCGGGSCPACGGKAKCKDDADCRSASCSGFLLGMTCDASCNDGTKSQNETDVDCGGTLCGPCGIGAKCLRNEDCENGYCHPTMRQCLTPNCHDGAMNQGELDVDCGGPCGPCGPGRTCTGDADCISHHCMAAACTGCQVAEDCKPTGNECAVLTCASKICGAQFLDGTHTLSTGQTSGNCSKVVCNGAGGTQGVTDPGDVPTSNTVCKTDPRCEGSSPTFTNAALGTDCSADGIPSRHVCNGTGSCVGCNADLDCTTSGQTCNTTTNTCG